MTREEVYCCGAVAAASVAVEAARCRTDVHSMKRQAAQAAQLHYTSVAFCGLPGGRDSSWGNTQLATYIELAGWRWLIGGLAFLRCSFLSTNCWLPLCCNDRNQL